MTTGSAPVGHTLTKAPPMRLTTPGSVLMAATDAATATSTALPPSAATSRPASSAEALGAARATLVMRPPYAGSWPAAWWCPLPGWSVSGLGPDELGADELGADELGGGGLGVGAGRLAQRVERRGDGRHALQVGGRDREDLAPRRGGERESRDLVVLGGVEDEVGHEGHPQPGRDEPELRDVVLGLERHVGPEAGGVGERQEMAATAGAAG